MAPLLCQFLRHLECYSMLLDSLELSGVVCLPYEEKTRLYLELIAGIYKKSNAIDAKWGHSAFLAF